jgi:hypothetical protein
MNTSGQGILVWRQTNPSGGEDVLTKRFAGFAGGWQATSTDKRLTGITSSILDMGVAIGPSGTAAFTFRREAQRNVASIAPLGGNWGEFFDIRSTGQSDFDLALMSIDAKNNFTALWRMANYPDPSYTLVDTRYDFSAGAWSAPRALYTDSASYDSKYPYIFGSDANDSGLTGVIFGETFFDDYNSGRDYRDADILVSIYRPN